MCRSICQSVGEGSGILIGWRQIAAICGMYRLISQDRENIATFFCFVAVYMHLLFYKIVFIFTCEQEVEINE